MSVPDLPDGVRRGAMRIADIVPGVPYVEAALAFYRAGFPVIPGHPTEKRASVKWDSWLATLSSQSINAYYARHPDHTVCCIVDERFLVLDADTPLSVTALDILERQFGVESNFVVNTRRGQHRYYHLREGVIARTSAHSTEAHPERIDVKAGRSLVVLPPSPGKTIARCAISHVDQLTVVGQEFIDAVFAHNACEPPRVRVESINRDGAERTAFARVSPDALAAMLDRLDPDAGYDQWCRVLMAVHYESAGSEQGFALADAWSACGAKYPGQKELREKWRSFADYDGTPATAGTLRHYLAEQGIDAVQVCGDAEPRFEVCEYETVLSPAGGKDDRPREGNPDTADLVEGGVASCPSTDGPYSTPELLLAAFCVTSSIGQLKRGMLAEVYVLAYLALLGEITVLYAAPNVGKTLLVLWLLIEAIKAGRVQPAQLFYINSDDTLRGLIQKAEIAAAYGFHMLAGGFQGFENRNLQKILREVIEKGEAKGLILVFDTLKKFTDPMDKRLSSNFLKLLRTFALQGGTVICLAHTNKKPGNDGKPVYEGTSDVVNDADCVFTLRIVSPDGAAEKVVEFERKKARGNVVQRATFAYSGADGLSYDDVLASVRRVDDKEVAEVKAVGDARADAPIIEAIKVCIGAGIVKRMDLYATAGRTAGCGRRKAEQILDRYSGSDSSRHHWTYTIEAHGAKVYRLLRPDAPAPDAAVDDPQDTDHE